MAFVSFILLLIGFICIFFTLANRGEELMKEGKYTEAQARGINAFLMKALIAIYLLILLLYMLLV